MSSIHGALFVSVPFIVTAFEVEFEFE